MSVGNLQNNIEKLKSELRVMKYSNFPAHSKGFFEGNPTVMLPIVHYSLLSFSKLVAEFIYNQNFDMYTKNDYSFVELTYKLLRQKFAYRPILTIGQFLSPGFAERKILFCLDLIRIVKDKHLELLRFKKGEDRRPKSPNSVSRSPSSVSLVDFTEEPLPSQPLPPRPLPRTPQKSKDKAKEKAPEEIIADCTSIMKDVFPGNFSSFEDTFKTTEKQTPSGFDINKIFQSVSSPEDRNFPKVSSNYFSTPPSNKKSYLPAEDLNSTIKNLNSTLIDIQDKMNKIEYNLTTFMEKTDAKLILLTGRVKMLEQTNREETVKKAVERTEERNPPRKGLLAHIGITNTGSFQESESYREPLSFTDDLY